MKPFDFKPQFPVFQNRPGLVYLDSAATGLKPAVVIAAERNYEERSPTNVGRGLYPLAEEASAAYESAREKAARFLNASPEEIIFTAGTTAGLNMVARLVEPLLQKSANIVTTSLEHHSNYLPWKELAKRSGASLRVAPFSADGTLDPKAFTEIVNEHTAAVSFSAVSNVFGLVNPVADIVRAIRKHSPGAIVVVDAAQAVAHIPIDARSWDADFIAFSGHKVYGPTGIGVLFGKKSVLKRLAPSEFGGGMVLDSCSADALYRDIPERFEAGTPNISGAIGLGAVLDFITGIGFDTIREHDIRLVGHLITALEATFGDSIHILGDPNPAKRAGLVSFTLDNVHPHDVAQILGEQNICVRAGEHCAAPLHRALGIPASVRVSFGVYNDEGDTEKLIGTLKEATRLFENTTIKAQKTKQNTNQSDPKQLE